MLPITKLPIRYNFSRAGGRSIYYIVIHDTGNTGRGAGVDSHYNYFNGGNRSASADFFVDGNKIGQFNPDIRNCYMWHCGDGGGKYGITNSNSIGIEICVNSDGNYSKAVSNAVELTKYLMQVYGIPAKNVVRHYDASRKCCPSSMSSNSWSAWNTFKSRLGGAVSNPTSSVTLISWGSTGSDVLALQKNLNSLGYKSGTADGIFGRNTYNAIVAFQKDKKIGVDGIAGKDTLNAIKSAIAIKNKPKPIINKGAKKVKYLVIYNNHVDKRPAERLAEYLQCPTLDGDQVKSFDYSTVETPIGVGGGVFKPEVKMVLKGYDRDDTDIAVLKYIKKL